MEQSQKLREIYDTKQKENLKYKSPEGLKEELVKQISKDKKEQARLYKKG